MHIPIQRTVDLNVCDRFPSVGFLTLTEAQPVPRSAVGGSSGERLGPSDSGRCPDGFSAVLGRGAPGSRLQRSLHFSEVR